MARRDARERKTHRYDGNNPTYDKDYSPLPTAGQVREALKDVPDDAVVQIKTHDWGWPRWNFTIWAWWTRGGQKPEKSIDQLLEAARAGK